MSRGSGELRLIRGDDLVPCEWCAPCAGCGPVMLGGVDTRVVGKVIAELPVGFWRFLVESRYFTTLWIPANHAAFPGGPADARDRQRAVAGRLQQLTFVRNRAAHHEPIHKRDLIKDLRSATDLAGGVSARRLDERHRYHYRGRGKPSREL